jgi:hypothetical protein
VSCFRGAREAGEAGEARETKLKFKNPLVFKF